MDGVLIDGAHNPQGAAVLAEYLRAHVPGRRVLLVGMMHDKQVEACAKLLAPVASRVIATRVDDPRAASAEEVAAGVSGRAGRGFAGRCACLGARGRRHGDRLRLALSGGCGALFAAARGTTVFVRQYGISAYQRFAP